ncbi:MAG: phosphate ABC transporter ATP-binding protein [Chloroflexi bacterium]|nr:phosphate ABC transporter ATP-binding protein [Chloroflexota bacterium]
MRGQAGAATFSAKDISGKDVTAGFGKVTAIKDVTLSIRPNEITAIIGPSGCGKSTLLRCLNRMHEEVRGAWARGQVLLEGQDIYAPTADPVQIRRLVGMVFQKPNPFPTMSIFDNVAAGLRLTSWGRPPDLEERVERALRQAALWDEVKNDLRKPGTALSGGQQQRLCIARVLAVEPEVILMDEPASALDPISTLKVEELMEELKKRYTIVLVTHNMQQAARVSDWTAFLLLGELIEYNITDELFSRPRDRRTEDYITGRFG